MFQRGGVVVMANDQNSQRPKIQSHGYNGSEPTRICPKCKQETLISVEKFKILVITEPDAQTQSR